MIVCSVSVSLSLCRVHHLLLNTENLYSHLSDVFAPSGNAIGNAIAQLKESVALYCDCDYLRNKHILNPAGDIAAPVSAFPSHQILNSKVGGGSSFDCVNVYPELLCGDLYVEYVIYACIACPSVMYLAHASAVQEVLKTASGQCFFLRIYRDVVSKAVFSCNDFVI